jgi:acetyl esterase/lipase
MLCHYLKDKGTAIPKRLILVSPAGVLAEEDPETLNAMKRLESQDLFLSVDFKHTIAEIMKTGNDRNNYFDAPSEGNFSVFPETSIFSGTSEILNAQVPPLLKRLRSAGVKTDYYEGKEMMHIWPYMPFAPESRAALDRIFSLIQGSDTSKQKKPARIRHAKYRACPAGFR